jgi:translation initiation factor eIF-2B subunit alpha
MDTVDIILVGAEAIVENGGIINKMGTYQISLVAKDVQQAVLRARRNVQVHQAIPADAARLSAAGPSWWRRPRAIADLKPSAMMTDFTPPRITSRCSSPSLEC